MVALPWVAEQGWAVPVLNPSVDYSKANFAYSPPLRKFINSMPGLGSTARTPYSPLGPNDLNQFIPVATAGTLAGFPDDDYYEIALVEYRERMHGDLPAAGTKIRGYVQLVSSGAPGAVALTTANGLTHDAKDYLGNQLYGATKPHYMGPIILATKNKPVRIKFTNALPLTASGGDLFLPVDITLMGAGEGPKTAGGGNCDPQTQVCANYTQNRAAIHLHGGVPPWISDGTPHQWIAPANEVTPYTKGPGALNVPDMQVPPAGSVTMYWTNQQSGRLMFYHDHAVGITRLNVYAGEAAGYLVVDPMEETLLDAAGVPGTTSDLGHLIPLIIQDKSFVYDDSITTTPPELKDAARFTSVTDPLWDSVNWGAGGDLWFPHVYVPNQDPTDLSGANPLGRWDYGPWFWPVFPVATPYPPTVSAVPEAFMDTPVVNGTPYPYLEVEAAKYRLQILNAANDRMLNLQLYVADTGYTTPATATATVSGGVITGIVLNDGGTGYTPNSTPMVHIVGGGGYGGWATATVDGTGVVNNITLTDRGANYTSAPTVTVGGSTEVKMVPALPNPAIPFPAAWLAQTPGMIPDILDTRLGGVPDPTKRGPAMIQIATEGGLLATPALLPNVPVGYEQNKRNIVVLNVLEKTLFMGPAERADVIVDFTNFSGKTIILYNDAPAPVPAGDPRYDFYTGNPDYSSTGGVNNQGGAPPTSPGYGPNTRTIMQFRVKTGGSETAPVDDYDSGFLTALQTAIPNAFAAVQDVPIVPQPTYPVASGGYSATATYSRISNNSLTYTPVGSSTPVTMPLKPKAIQELFDPEGRMNATLGVELPFTNAGNQTTVPLGFFEPPTEKLKAGETQLWKITHNGVDTHPVHFHLVNVQVINRVGWDGAIRPPDDNELGWKETVRMNPLEDIIVAMKVKFPTYPFVVPNSIRPYNPAIPVGSKFASFDPLTGQPVTITNDITNFGKEYVWHCHILGHEENDMMRPVVVNADSLLYVTLPGSGLWQWDMGTWTKLHASVPASMVASGPTLYATFTGYGIYKYESATWTKITALIPSTMVTAGSTLYAAFTGSGLYKYDGATWTKLHVSVPANMIASGSVFYADFTGSGLYKWEVGAWTRLNPADPITMVSAF